MGKAILTRLYSEEAEALGLKVKPNEPNRSNARYWLKPKQKEALKKIRSHQKIKRLFFDIETSPMVIYSWRVGHNLNIPYDNIIDDWKIICISYKWEGSDKVYNLTWDKNQDERGMLEAFVKVAGEADELVAHNGDRFDLKKLRTRCIYHRVPMFPHYRTLDTLKKARGNFKFNSNRLDYIAKFLGVGQKVEHEGFNLWVKCVQGDKKALKEMVTYCDGDVVVLEDVFTVLQSYIKQNTHAGTINGGHKCDCPKCGNDHATLIKNNYTASGTIKRLMECDSCEYTYEISNRAYLDYLKRNAVSLL